VIDPQTNAPLTGEYTAGWIKRGPSGVIGTNKPDAVETVECLLADFHEGKMLLPEMPTYPAVEAFICQRQPRTVNYEDWLRLKEMEEEKGKVYGRPRIKFTRVEEMLTAVGK
jgi:ferredoxin--NADP+ reductase